MRYESLKTLRETFRRIVIEAERESAEPVGYRVYGPYERSVFRDIGSAEAYRNGLNKGFGEYSYAIQPLFTLPPAQKETVSCNTKIATEAIRLALKSRNFPSNPDNAARAGWDACLSVNFPPAPQPCPSKEGALEALDNMDDYARMGIGVDAIGPRKVLEDYIKQPCPDCESSEAIMEMHCAKVRSQAARIKELEADVEKWSTDFVRISDNYSEEAKRNMDFGAERCAFIIKEQKQAVRIKELEAALTKLACLGNGDTYGNSIGNEIAIAALKGEKK